MLEDISTQIGEVEDGDYAWFVRVHIFYFVCQPKAMVDEDRILQFPVV